MNNTSDNKRIIKNSILLYLRMLLIMMVNLYTSRVVLNTLGVEDYGLYSVVGSVVVFFGFLNTSMAAASQRFLSYEKGLGDPEKLSSTFNSIILVQVYLAAVVILLCETLGIYYINHFLNVAAESKTAAHVVFQLSTLSFVINVLAVPYLASVFANEEMGIFALLSILDAFLKLGLTVLVTIFPSHKLEYFAMMMLLCTIVIQSGYVIYGTLRFKECRLKKNSNNTVVKKVLSYSGWNLLGTFSGVAIDQGVNMILNSYFGVIVNAARGISFQVSGALSQLCGSFQQALNPQIVKTYAQDNRERMHILIIQGAKLSFFLLLVFVLPVIFNIDSILSLWLGIVPEYTAVFCVLVIVNSLINSISQPLLQGAMATGNIKKYQIIVSFINILNFPLSLVGLYFYRNPFLTVYIMILLSLVALGARLFLVNKMIGLSISRFLNEALLPIVLSIVVSLPAVWLIYIFVESGSTTFMAVVIRGFIMFFVVGLCIWVVGTKQNERKLIIDYIKNLLKRC